MKNTYIYYAIIALIIILLLFYFMKSPATNNTSTNGSTGTPPPPPSYMIYYNRITILPSNNCVSVMNDNVNIRTFKYSGNKDGILYETTPYAGNFQYAMLVMKTAIIDYYSKVTAVINNISIPHPEIISTTIPYVGIMVSAKNNVIDSNITSNYANIKNWLGVCDLSILFAKFIAAGYSLDDIGTYTGVLPTVNNISGNNPFSIASIVNFPSLINSGNNDNVYDETFGPSTIFGLGLSISPDGGKTIIYDSQYYQNNKTTSTPFPTINN